MTPTAMAAPHSSPSPDLGAQKAALRRRMLALRVTQDPARGADLAAHVLRDSAIPSGAAVAGVWPLSGEIDLRPLWHALHARGHAVLLPHTTPPGQSLHFRHWRPGTPMLRERFGTEYPDGPLGTPNVIFVPLLAFDRRGHRLGYGGGYYDRTLAAHPRALSVGIGYAAQEVAEVPIGPHDWRLGAIFTELGAVALPGSSAHGG